MKEAIVSPGPSVELVDSPIPDPVNPTDVVIKVAVSGSNPKDWKIPEWFDKVHNSGDDIAGTVHKAGSAVGHLFAPGQRVAAFHRMMQPHGSYAEYAVAPAHTTFHIPAQTSFEEAATIPLAALTAAAGLFVNLGLPEPWQGGGVNGKREGKPAPGPLIVYGAASAVGAFAIKLAKRAGIGPLLCVAGHGIPFVEGLVDKSNGDVIVDYRQGDDAVVEGLKNAAKGKKLEYAFDAVSEKGSYHNLYKIMGKGGKVATVLPTKDISPELDSSWTSVGTVHDSQTDFGTAWTKMLELGLQEGWFTAHPHEVVPGGLNGVQTALKNLKDGKVSAVKYVFKISDTS